MTGESQSLEEEEEWEGEKEGTGARCILMVVLQHHCLLPVGSPYLDMVHVSLCLLHVYTQLANNCLT